MKEVGVQTFSEGSVGPRTLSKSPFPEFEFPQVFYGGGTLLWLLVASCVLGAMAFYRDDSDSGLNHRQGFIGIIGILIFISAVYLPDSGMMFRPHPAIWRMLQGISLCYAGFVVFMLFQNIDDARQFMAWLDPSLGVPLPEQDYASDCRVYTPEDPDSNFANLKNCIFDVYILAHAIGWYVKMMVFRDVKLALIISCFFEFMEITLRHQLANFYECWWDSLVLDILVCNGGGIYLGYLTCRVFEMREYYWGVGKDNRNDEQRFTLTRSAQQFTPYSWLRYKWEMFSSCKMFISTIWYIAFVNLVDLSNFYLKYLLWMPSNHWILLIRVLFWAMQAIIATREYYEYVDSGFTKILGSHCWLAHLLVFLEWAFIVKNSAGLFTEPMPEWLQYTWTSIAASVISISFYLFYKDLNKK